MLPQFIKSRQKPLEEIAKDNQISYLALFGSYARGEQKPDSDLDLLVNFKKPVDFFELYDIEQELARTLDKKIDLVTVNGLNRHIKPYIQRDLQVIYESS